MPAGASSFEPDLGLWDPWTPAEVAERLQGVEATWYVVAGWALDLFQGRRMREHEDLEIGVADRDFGSIRRALGAYELFVVGDGLARTLDESTLATHRQTWVREPATGAWRLDIIRERWEDDVWVFQRDRRIRLTRDELIAQTSEGVPFIQPEVVLLFKAKAVRPKDDEDFARVLPVLDESRRAWLATALELVHPGHRWLRALAADA